jgi:murein DD-endopeptidase MepM/ murein hydrolase activator NlpD
MKNGLHIQRNQLRSAFWTLVAFQVAFGFARAEPPRIVQVFDNRQDEMNYAINVRYETVVRAPVTLTVRVELKNMSSDKSLPLNVVLREEGVYELLRIKRRDAQTEWNFEFDSHWQFGDMNARHMDRVSYRLPFSGGTRFEMTQGYNGKFSHNGVGAFAVDFAMPEGTAVCAARKGWVVWTRGDVTTTIRSRPPGQRENVPANEVVILHDDGTIGWYMHFRPGGIEVPVGRFVREGDVIGRSGDTGLSSQPHLHFEVYKPVDGYVRQTVPVRFVVKDEAQPVQLEEGRTYETR